MVTTLKRRRGADGFTLIELIVTLAVAAILAVLAVPSFKNLIAQSEMRSASTDFALAMTRARSEATKRAAPVTVGKKGTWAAGWTITDSGGAVLFDQDALRGVTVTGGKSPIQYLSSGRIGAYVESDYRFTLTSDRVSTIIRCVGIDSSGGSYIAEGACP